MRKAGLTLLEIIVSVVILALIAGGLANVFVAGKRWVLHSRSRMTGGELGKAFLDPIQNDVRQDKWDATPAQLCLKNQALCQTQNPAQTISNTLYTPTYEISNADNVDPTVTTLTRVKVRLNWLEPTS